MLEHMKLENVGPAPEMELDLAERLNIITGDNGLGKSFLLDVAWWALTLRWPHDLNPKLESGYRAVPTDPKKSASMAFRLASKSGDSREYVSKQQSRRQGWFTGSRPFPPDQGLVIYAHADGGFSVWDPVRNDWRGGPNFNTDRLPAYVFSANEVWDGLEAQVEGKQTVVSNGLIRDCAGWIREGGRSADSLDQLLHNLAPKGETLSLGPVTRLSVADARDVPSIRTAYSPSVPIVHASAGIRRIFALAYILLWSWQEHGIAARQLGEKRTTRVMMLFDEIESHLHPRWQRSILGSVLRTAQQLHEEASVQMLVATHSPLVLASAEPIFDPDKDAWFDIDLRQETGEVVLQKRRFERRGTAGKWLTSEAFDLPSEGRSLEAEKAISDAEHLLDRRKQGDKVTKKEVRKIDEALRGVLSDTDRVWVRWSALVEELEGKR